MLQEDPKEVKVFPCMDDCGDGFGRTKYDIEEQQEAKVRKMYPDEEEIEDDAWDNFSDDNYFD